MRTAVMAVIKPYNFFAWSLYLLERFEPRSFCASNRFTLEATDYAIQYI